ncbi:hypothetical protein ACFV2X_07635 [Streptomyces sp. NPDC059679]|uniref:hypothetical protein n=1 Tax=Streptomyces sp. NPDC059679 TaxID=3346903 RepID=UPI00368885F6
MIEGDSNSFGADVEVWDPDRMCEEGLVRPGTVVLNVNSHSGICGAFTVFGSGVRAIGMVSICR